MSTASRGIRQSFSDGFGSYGTTRNSAWGRGGCTCLASKQSLSHVGCVVSPFAARAEKGVRFDVFAFLKQNVFLEPYEEMRQNSHLVEHFVQTLKSFRCFRLCLMQCQADIVIHRHVSKRIRFCFYWSPGYELRGGRGVKNNYLSIQLAFIVFKTDVSLNQLSTYSVRTGTLCPGANRECMQLTSGSVIIADYVFAYDVLLMYMCGYCEARRVHCS